MQDTKEELQDLLKIEGINCKGFGVIPKAVMLDKELTMEAKTIYAYFCSFAGNGTTTFPKRDTITSHLKITKDYYYKHFKLLEEQGFISVERTGIFPYKNLYTLINNPKKFNDTESAYNKDYSQIKYSGLKSHGFGTVPRALMIDDRLDIKAKGIYAYLCSYAGSGIAAFPQVHIILYQLKIGRQAYYKYYKQLVDCNYITVIQRKAESGKFSVADYYLNENPDVEILAPCDDLQDNEKTLVKSAFSPCDDLPDNAPCDDLPDDESPDDESPDNDRQDTIINSITKNSIINNQSNYHEKTIDREKLHSDIFEELLENKGIPYSYKTDKFKMTEAIHILAEWDIFHPNGYTDESKQDIYELIVSCLIDMTCFDGPMKLKGSIVYYSNIIDKINSCIVFGDFNEFMSIQNFIEDVLNDYENASIKYEIKAYVPYMKSCIWNSFLSHKVKFNSLVNKII